MASIINALSSGTGGIVTAGDASGILQLQTANTAALTVNTNGSLTVASTGSGITYASSGGSGLRMYGAGGTNQWDVYGNGANIRFSDNTGGGIVVVDSNLRVGGTLGVGGNQPSTSGAGITFPATQSASSDANTLDDYREGSYTGTLTGCTTSPTTTVYYTKIGNIVHLSNLAAGITGTSNASTMRLTGMPALIRPANASKAAVQGGISGSVSQTIWAQVLSNGDIYCEQGGNSWPTSGVKGFDSGFGITYSIL